MDVVGGDDLEAEVAGGAPGPFEDLLLLLEAVVLDLEVEVLRAEDLLEVVGGLEGLVHLVGAAGHAELGVGAAREGEKPLVVGGQDLLVHAGLPVEALLVGRGSELEEVPIALLVADQEGEVVVGLLQPRDLFAVEARAGSDVGLHADDGLHALLEAAVVEFDRAQHVAVVGEGAGLHAQTGDAGRKIRDLARAVQEGIVAMDVEVDELRFHAADYRTGEGSGQKLTCGPMARPHNDAHVN